MSNKQTFALLQHSKSTTLRVTSYNLFCDFGFSLLDEFEQEVNSVIYDGLKQLMQLRTCIGRN